MNTRSPDAVKMALLIAQLRQPLHGVGPPISERCPSANLPSRLRSTVAELRARVDRVLGIERDEGVEITCIERREPPSSNGFERGRRGAERHVQELEHVLRAIDAL